MGTSGPTNQCVFVALLGNPSWAQAGSHADFARVTTRLHEGDESTREKKAQRTKVVGDELTIIHSSPGNA